MPQLPQVDSVAAEFREAIAALKLVQQVRRISDFPIKSESEYEITEHANLRMSARAAAQQLRYAPPLLHCSRMAKPATAPLGELIF